MLAPLSRFVSCAALAATLASASPADAMPPPPPTEWRPELLEGPAFFCANGMGVALREGESLQLATRRPWVYVQLGPLSRVRLRDVTLEVRWPALAYRNEGDVREVYSNARMVLIPVSAELWALSLEPGRAGGDDSLDSDDVQRMFVIRFPFGDRSAEGLEFARRVEFVASGDPRCTDRP